MIYFDYRQLPKRDILCIDVKSFFASVESVKRGIHPLDSYIVVMSNQESSGGLVLAAAPRVKQEYGIKTGSRRFEIPKNSPIQIVAPRMSLYLKVNALIQEIFRKYVADEDWYPYSIDEGFLDVTASHQLFGTTEEIARKIQLEIWQKLKLVVTIGIGDNPLLSKLALDNAAKDAVNGMASWRYETIPETIWKIPKLTDFWGIGYRTANSLEKIGIHTIYQLAQTDISKLKKTFGIIGEQLFYHAHGIDFTRLSERHIPQERNFCKSQILKQDYTKQYEIEIVIREMADQLAARLRTHHLEAGVLSLSIGLSKYATTKGFQIQRKINPTDHSKEIVATFIDLFRAKYQGEAVRSIFVSCAHLKEKETFQLNLFEDIESVKTTEAIDQTIDLIRHRFGYPSIVKANSLMHGATAIERTKLVGGHQG
ncbi:Y-family DNA polymerase [Isobaculum melis]|uniref:DNA polymerase V n=1 Tax=Isobaculum melis TaxID=142588 RepID=A0A1H9QH81_9LACT|nr:Y-family DNA polymerase [Isobaculum melis]SER59911.1 DNA polymerase V [Isobaculum melis]